MTRSSAALLLLTSSTAWAGQVVAGHHVTPIDAGTGVALEQQVVMGGDGGTTLTGATVRVQREALHFSAFVPWGGYNTPAGRDGSLGNLMLGGYYALSETLVAGTEVHFNLAEGAWSWTNAADELWPGVGVRGVALWRIDGESFSLATRGALGVAGNRAVQPFPKTRLQFEAASAFDKPLSENLGLIGELSIKAWDTSPLDLTGMVRFDPLENVRARAGLVLPVGCLLYTSPSPRDGLLSRMPSSA